MNIRVGLGVFMCLSCLMSGCNDDDGATRVSSPPTSDSDHSNSGVAHAADPPADPGRDGGGRDGDRGGGRDGGPDGRRDGGIGRGGGGRDGGPRGNFPPGGPVLPLPVPGPGPGLGKPPLVPIQKVPLPPVEPVPPVIPLPPPPLPPPPPPPLPPPPIPKSPIVPVGKPVVTPPPIIPPPVVPPPPPATGDPIPVAAEEPAASVPIPTPTTRPASPDGVDTSPHDVHEAPSILRGDYKVTTLHCSGEHPNSMKPSFDLSFHWIDSSKGAVEFLDADKNRRRIPLKLSYLDSNRFKVEPDGIVTCMRPEGGAIECPSERLELFRCGSEDHPESVTEIELEKVSG